MSENTQVEPVVEVVEPATAVVQRAQIVLPAAIRAQLGTEVANIQKRIGAPAGNRIKVTQKKTFRLPTGEESAGPFEAIILDFISANYFYTGVYDPDDIAPPACFALGTEVATLVPHADVPADTKQADTCASCPQNQFGTAQRGKGKACSNCRVIALLPPDATAETPIMTMKISPTAIRAFDSYVASIARSFGTPPIAVVTSIGFDPSSDYPSVRFGDPKPVNEAQIALAMARREEAQQILQTPPDTTSLKVEQLKQPVVTNSRRGRV
jgi:hypothetical protein